ncbi:DUF2793 domain-containing protein [Shinella sp. S4-D37]|uniref:DUF2793 domain-containing protein n=1 Tax=Shinella sp. S4-D37 TaxID=3161999 RepID=UPI003467C2B3
MSEQTTLLALPYILPSQAQKHVTHNEVLRMLDALLHLHVAGFGVDMPPESPEEGERHLVGGTPSGAFAPHAGEIAAFQDGAWAFYAPRPGWTLWDAAGEALHVFRDGSWTEIAAEPDRLPQLGIATDADTVNRLAVSAEATLLTHAGAGHQLKLNKATPDDTASLLFQTGWSGRVEMGLAGTDDFSVKVSPDGAAWKTALVVNRTTGEVGIGGSPLSSMQLFVTGANAMIGLRATEATKWAGLKIYNNSGTQVGGFQYGNPGASDTANELVFATFSAGLPMKFYQGGVATGNERLRFDTSGRIALLGANVGVGTATPHASAQMEIASTTRGFLPPRMSEAERDAIAAPAEGLIIYNTTVHAPQFWNGTGWMSMG